ncbi:hypothetical protein [Actinomadura nitritigenes]|uniref:hypothetical protein n=1 Tax=Actinomadura nitritigenes TaxID=134602 RepID=UPI003D913383
MRPLNAATYRPNHRVRCQEHIGVHNERVECRWPYSVTADGDEPEFGRPYRVTD